MRRIKNKDSEIEVKLRKESWSRGLRYQKNVTGIVGKLDIIFKGKKVAVFCDSEFFHGYDRENWKYDFKSNLIYSSMVFIITKFYLCIFYYELKRIADKAEISGAIQVITSSGEVKIVPLQLMFW